jgi:hypothetical protein
MSAGTAARAWKSHAVRRQISPKLCLDELAMDLMVFDRFVGCAKFEVAVEDT